jgi:hypothetical protein
MTKNWNLLSNGGDRVQCSPNAGQFPSLSSSHLPIITYENGENRIKKE